MDDSGSGRVRILTMSYRHVRFAHHPHFAWASRASSPNLHLLKCFARAAGMRRARILLLAITVGTAALFYAFSMRVLRNGEAAGQPYLRPFFGSPLAAPPCAAACVPRSTRARVHAHRPLRLPARAARSACAEKPSFPLSVSSVGRSTPLARLFSLLAALQPASPVAGGAREGASAAAAGGLNPSALLATRLSDDGGPGQPAGTLASAHLGLGFHARHRGGPEGASDLGPGGPLGVGEAARRAAEQLAALRLAPPPPPRPGAAPADHIDAESRRRWKRAEWSAPSSPPDPGRDDPWVFYAGTPGAARELRQRHAGARPVPGDGSLSAAALADPAVLVLAYNRPRYLLETLRSLSEQEELPRFKVYVSQDGAPARLRPR